MQALLGKTGAQGLKRRIHTHDLKTVKQDWIDQVNDLLKDVDLAEMENISDQNPEIGHKIVSMN